MADGPKPSMPDWHVRVETGGVSRQERSALAAFALNGILQEEKR